MITTESFPLKGAWPVAIPEPAVHYRKCHVIAAIAHRLQDVVHGNFMRFKVSDGARVVGYFAL